MIRPVPTVGAAAEPGTPGGVSRREFVRALTAGSAAALAAGVRSPAAQAGAAARMRAAQAEAPDDEAFWADVRHEFLIPEELAYMNSGTLGPMPKPVYYAVVDGYRALAADPGRTNTAQNSVQNELREKLATFVNADTDEVALTRNTTEGMSFVANGLDLDPGDEVLLSFHEHPGGLQPWRLAAARRGVVVKELPFPIPTSDPSDIVGLFEAAITPRTKVISVSHVTFATGCMLPVRELAALARPRGIVTVVDGAHAIGMLHLDMHDLGMDCYASSPYKWMGAPVGSGFLYMRRDVQDRIWPTVVTTGWDDAEGGAARFDRLSQRRGADRGGNRCGDRLSGGDRPGADRTPHPDARRAAARPAHGDPGGDDPHVGPPGAHLWHHRFRARRFRPARHRGDTLAAAPCLGAPHRLRPEHGAGVDAPLQHGRTGGPARRRDP